MSGKVSQILCCGREDKIPQHVKAERFPFLLFFYTHGLMLPVQSEPTEQQGVVRYHAQGFSLPAKEDAAGGLQAAAILVRPLQPVKLRTTVL